MYLFIHGQLLREANEFERSVKQLNKKDGNQVNAVVNHFEFLHKGLRAHEEGEERILFPAFEKRFRHIADSYVFDHEHQNDTILDDVSNTLENIARKGPDAELADRLYRQTVAFNATLHLHVLKENELLLPIMYSEFDVAEQADIIRQMAGHVPPEISGPFLSRTFRSVAQDERELLLRTLIQLVPRPVFDGMTKMLSGSIPSGEWQNLLQRIPEITKAP
jgi:hemerythrin-like domain-containing protein